MDLLKETIQQKKKEVDELKNNTSFIGATSINGKKKYLRRGDIEKIVEEKQNKLNEHTDSGLKRNHHNDNHDSSSKAAENDKSIDSKRQKVSEICKVNKDSSGNKTYEPEMSLEKVIKRLRNYNQPITLFGEDLIARIERLNSAQNKSLGDKNELGEGHDIRNQFLERNNNSKNRGASPNIEKMDSKEEEVDEEDEKESTTKQEVSNERLVYGFFRRMLKLWEAELGERPDPIKFSTHGKVATMKLKQCKDYIRPLFKQCKNRSIPPEILEKLVEIVDSCERKEFVRANDAYISVAIGTAAWPIGVTMVGIHERTGREKINSQKQAHVMNNEVQRKYLTSVKRLITYCQSISNVLPSQKNMKTTFPLGSTSLVWFTTITFSTGIIIGVAVEKQQWRKRWWTWVKSKFYPQHNHSEVLSLVRSNILQLNPYRCARDDYQTGVLLDANENSFGPTLPDDLIDCNDPLERYPCPYQLALKQKIASFRHLQTDQIFLGVGSDEAIDLLIRIFCSPLKDKILITPPTYGMYSVCAHINDVDIVSVPLTPSFDLDLPNILNNLGSSIKIIFLCNPGNPTAKLLSEWDIMSLLEHKEFHGLIVVDEAYIDFAEKDKTMCRFIDKFDRLIVLQTFSKSFGLAGIRLGMAYANSEIIQIMNNVKAPYNVNKLTSKIALSVFSNLAKFHKHLKLINKEKKRVMKELDSIPSINRVFVSDTNFIVFEIKNAYQVYKLMAEEGVVIRYRGNLIHMKDCLRATIGKPSENDLMLCLLRSVSSRINKE